MKDLYNFIIDHKNEIKELISYNYKINSNNIFIKLKTNDLSLQILIDSEKINKKLNTKTIFSIDRLNNHLINDNFIDILNILDKYKKYTERYIKISKLKRLITV
jgi:archaellum biogenesis ATPase FlaH